MGGAPSERGRRMGTLYRIVLVIMLLIVIALLGLAAWSARAGT